MRSSTMFGGAAALTLLAFGACTTEEPAGEGTGATIEHLAPEAHLNRISMALRGTRPSLADLAEVRDDPSAIGAITDRYLATPEFGATMRDLHNEALLVRTERGFPALEVLQNVDFATVNRSLLEAPLRLVEHVVMNDRPYTEIVTADYTLADGIVAGVWNTTYDAGGPEWQVAHYKDGRPHAGVLTDSIYYVQHESNGSNYNRGRANAISKALLCFDFLDRDIVFDGSVDLADPDAVANAVVENQTCAGCHQTLDALASFFWGFRGQVRAQQIQGYPIPIYAPGNEDRWQGTTRRAPAYFGAPGARLDDLGRFMAEDPRFSLCASKRFYAYMTQTQVDAVPQDVAAELQQTLVGSGFSAKALARAVVLSDGFRVSHANDDDEAEELVGYLKVRPEQLDRMIADLTGYRWQTALNIQVNGITIGTVDLLQSDIFGFRVLAGGIDSFFVTEPSHTMNPTASLTLRALSAEAAGHVVEADFASADPAGRKLLARVGPDETAEPVVRAQIAELHLRLFAEPADPESVRVSEIHDVFQRTLARTGDVRRAWKTTLTAMLQDVRLAYY